MNELDKEEFKRLVALSETAPTAKVFCELFKCYYEAKGTDKNLNKAFECAKKATELDEKYALAWYHLGRCYACHIGVETNYDAAFKFYKKATELDENCKVAWGALMCCYELGLGVEINRIRSIECYEKAQPPVPILFRALKDKELQLKDKQITDLEKTLRYADSANPMR